MKKRALGRTGLEISELALGGLFVSSHGGEFEQSKAAIQRALELGINAIDTAPGYANSEEVLGKVLDGNWSTNGERLILSTKLGGRPQPFDPQDKAGLRHSVEESLRLLKKDYIDILMIHEPDRPGQYNWWADKERFTGPVTELLDELKQEGLIRFAGLGGTTAYEMTPIVQTGKFDVLLTAFNYSALWREAERVLLPAAVEQGMAIVIGSPLQQGALAKKHDEVETGAPWLSPPRRDQLRELYRFVDEIGISLPELGLRFVLSNPHVSSVLTGARSVAEVESSAEAAAKGPLEPAVLQRLDEIAAMVPFRPFLEPFCLPFGRQYDGPGA